MKKEKNILKKKKTVYSIMVEQFINAGYEVREDSWQENIGYGQPTDEYWFDVVIKTENNKVFTLHHWFGPDLNNLVRVEAWSHELITTEVNHENIF